MRLLAALLQTAIAVHAASLPVQAPVLSVNGVDGRQTLVRPAVLRTVLLVHFFSLQDPGWGDELLRLQRFDERFAKDGLAILSFAAPRPGAREAVADFAVQHGIHFPLAVDSGNMSAFGADRIPRLVLITPDAEIAVRLYSPAGEATLGDIAARLPALFARRRAVRAMLAARAREEKKIAEAAKHIAALSPERLRQKLKDRPALFFLGGKEAFDQKHIPGARRLDPGAVDAYFAGKDKGREWIFYCACAHDPLGLSGRAAAELYMKGFKRAAYLRGQLQGWEKLGYPLEGRKVR